MSECGLAAAVRLGDRLERERARALLIEDRKMTPFDFRVLSYVAGLELALDRLRKQSRFFDQEVKQFLQQLDTLCQRPDAATAGAGGSSMDQLRGSSGRRPG